VHHQVESHGDAHHPLTVVGQERRHGARRFGYQRCQFLECGIRIQIGKALPDLAERIPWIGSAQR
jgi:hypothetical protein